MVSKDNRSKQDAFNTVRSKLMINTGFGEIYLCEVDSRLMNHTSDQYYILHLQVPNVNNTISVTSLQV